MSDCDQEMCPMWDGDTCPCETFGFDRENLPTDGVYTIVWHGDDERDDYFAQIEATQR